MQTIDNTFSYDTLIATKLFGFYMDDTTYVAIFSQDGKAFGFIVETTDDTDINVIETYEGKFQMFMLPEHALDFFEQYGVLQTFIDAYKAEFNL